MRWVAFFICCVFCFVATSAQTVKPTRTWADQIDALARALVHPTDTSAFHVALTEDVVVRGIDGASAQYSQLATSAIDGEVVTARGYQMPATTIASDIAADFSASNSIPESIRRVMVPAGDKEMRQANDVATHWISQALSVTEGQHIGVIILRGKASATQPAETADENRSLIMVLIKGDLNSDGNPQITHLVFGDPRSLTK
jgi:hypothetical protein